MPEIAVSEKQPAGARTSNAELIRALSGSNRVPVRLRDTSQDVPGTDEPDRRAVNHVAAKMGLGVAAIALAAGLIALGLGVQEAWILVLGLPAATGLGAYACTMLLVERRLRLARSILRQIRKRRFENLEAAHLPRGDELNDLIWQVYRTGQTLEKEMAGLRQMENYRREFIGNVSHELKTPIFAIRGFAETLENGALEDPEVNTDFLRRILRNADRLNNLARDLGEISRLETGELKMVMRPFNLRDTVQEVIESLEPMARAASVSLAHAIPELVPDVLGDGDHLRQVISNLIENAIKYNSQNGRVEVSARLVRDDEVKVSIVDNGIGIPTDHIPRITERFYRVDKSRSRSQGGTGLGLAIVKHILAAHDRNLMVESRPGSGSTFGFSLPAAPH